VAGVLLRQAGQLRQGGWAGAPGRRQLGRGDRQGPGDGGTGGQGYFLHRDHTVIVLLPTTCTHLGTRTASLDRSEREVTEDPVSLDPLGR
jgi:hypothetical protein